MPVRLDPWQNIVGVGWPSEGYDPSAYRAAIVFTVGYEHFPSGSVWYNEYDTCGIHEAPDVGGLSKNNTATSIAEIYIPGWWELSDYGVRRVRGYPSGDAIAGAGGEIVSKNIPDTLLTTPHTGTGYSVWNNPQQFSIYENTYDQQYSSHDGGLRTALSNSVVEFIIPARFIGNDQVGYDAFLAPGWAMRTQIWVGHKDVFDPRDIQGLDEDFNVVEAYYDGDPANITSYTSHITTGTIGLYQYDVGIPWTASDHDVWYVHAGCKIDMTSLSLVSMGFVT